MTDKGQALKIALEALENVLRLVAITAEDTGVTQQDWDNNWEKTWEIRNLLQNMPMLLDWSTSYPDYMNRYIVQAIDIEDVTRNLGTEDGVNEQDVPYIADKMSDAIADLDTLPMVVDNFRMERGIEVNND